MQERIRQVAGSSCIRQRIVQAAIRLHSEFGFRKTTVADIARRASMSPANVYRFFVSKQAIEEAVVADLFEWGSVDRSGRRLTSQSRGARIASGVCG